MNPPPLRLHARQGDSEISICSRDDVRDWIPRLAYSIGWGLMDGRTRNGDLKFAALGMESSFY